MFKLNRVLGGALLVGALLGSQIARADDEKPVNLVVTPKVGRVVRTKSVIKTSFMGMDLIVNQTQKNTIKEVKANGDIVEETADEGSVVSIGGQEQNQPAAPSYTVTTDKLGKIKVFREVAAGEFMSPEVSKLMEVLGSFILTEKAVKTNDTWQNELDNPAIKEKKITIKDTYLGTEKIDGKDCWKIKQTGEAVVDADGAKMSFEATEWVNSLTGEPVKLEGTVKDVPTQVGALTLKIVSNAVKADEKEKAAPAKL